MAAVKTAVWSLLRLHVVCAVCADIRIAAYILLGFAALAGAEKPGGKNCHPGCKPPCMQVLCMQLMLACITAYNALADLLPLLPSASPVGTAIQHKATLLALPSMLRCAVCA